MRTMTWWIVGALLAASVACGPQPAPVPPVPPPTPPIEAPPPVAEPPPLVPTRATLAVVVTDAASGHPLPGAHVVVHTGESGETNADGYLAFADLVFGERGLTVSLDGYRDAHAFADPFTANLQLPVSLVTLAPPAPVPPQHPNPLIGRLRVDNGCYADDTGCVLPVFAHAGDLFSVYVRDQHRARDQLERIAAAGYHGIRVWAQLGCGNASPCPAVDDYGRVPFWRGREVGPGLTVNFQRQWFDFLSLLNSLQLRAVVSQGDPAQMGHTLAERRVYATWLAQVCRDVDGTGSVCAFVDAGNEAWQNDADRFYSDQNPDHAANMADFIRAFKQAGGTALASLTSPPGEDVAGPQGVNAYSIPPADVWDVHSFRDLQWWDKRRHVFSLPYEGKPQLRLGISSEPPGNGALVSASSGKDELDHEALADIAAMAAISRQAFVWFSGEGVKLDRGLEIEQGFAAVPRVLSKLPKDVMRFRQLHHSGDSWRSLRVFQLTGDPDVRVDGVMGDDGRFAYVMDGPSGTHRFIVDKGFDGIIIDAGTGETHPFAGKVGQSLDVSWTRGRVVVGQVVH